VSGAELQAAAEQRVAKDELMDGARIEIRPADERERRPLAHLFAAVAEERDGIAAEPPIDVEERATSWRLDGMLVATANGEIWDLIEMGLQL
jgi:hypothetical protein